MHKTARLLHIHPIILLIIWKVIKFQIEFTTWNDLNPFQIGIFFFRLKCRKIPQFLASNARINLIDEGKELFYPDH